MNDQERKPSRQEPELEALPVELRPYATRVHNPVVRPGDDPRLDAAVAKLKELTASDDPLFYDVKHNGDDASRGIGNVRVYIAPQATKAGGKTKLSRQVVLVVGLLLGLLIAGVAVLVLRGMQPAGGELQGVAAPPAVTTAPAAIATHAPSAAPTPTEEPVQEAPAAPTATQKAISQGAAVHLAQPAATQSKPAKAAKPAVQPSAVPTTSAVPSSPAPSPSIEGTPEF